MGNLSALGIPEPLEASTSIDPQHLIGDPRLHAGGAVEAWWFWCGVVQEAPFQQAEVGGVTFAKLTQLVTYVDGEQQRMPRVGDVYRLTAADAKRMLERLPLVFVRIHEEQQEEPGTGRNTENTPVRRRRGHLITVTGRAEIKWRQEKGMPIPRYDYKATDEPVARYLFAVLCEDQQDPQPGQRYPATLAQAPFHFPVPIQIGEPA